VFHLNFSVNLFLVVINFYLIITLTRKWSESHFGPRRVLTSCINFFFLLFTRTWSIWLCQVIWGYPSTFMYFLVLEESTRHNHIINGGIFTYKLSISIGCIMQCMFACYFLICLFSSSLCITVS